MGPPGSVARSSWHATLVQTRASRWVAFAGQCRGSDPSRASRAKCARNARAEPGSIGGVDDGIGEGSVGTADVPNGAAPAEADVVLEARGLVKDYRRARAVDGVDVTVHAGERVALLGPNGAGKTTTLFMILGVVAPDAGAIEILGHRLDRHRSGAAENVGFAAGYLPLTERMRVREYLRMFGQIYGIADPSAQIAAGLERFRIAHLADAMGTELSSGQRTLIGIVR